MRAGDAAKVRKLHHTQGGFREELRKFEGGEVSRGRFVEPVQLLFDAKGNQLKVFPDVRALEPCE